MRSHLLMKLSCLLLAISFAVPAYSQAPDGRVEIFISPLSGSFVEGSTFQVPVLINTNGASVEGIKIKINFDKDKLSIVEPSGGKSIIGVWLESPSYDNDVGTASYTGDIPEGIVTESGLVATITFKAIGSGQATIGVNPISEIYFHNDLRTKAQLDPGRAVYDILVKLSEGPDVFSETHPSPGKWYNNDSPIISWKNENGASGWSFILDNKPYTVPDNTIDSEETTKSFENLNDGLWYFHVKAMKLSGWGTSAHFLMKIDTAPPAEFTPSANSLFASTILTGRMLISFFTTDNLSGVDHYEVGTIDKNQPITEAPVFIQTSSPFQVPIMDNSASISVIVRAFDKAGNMREGTAEIHPPFVLWGFIKSHPAALTFAVILLLLMLYTLKKYRVIRPISRNGSFNALENDIENYLSKKKETNEINMREKEKIEILEKDLEKVKAEINKEIQN